LQSRDPEIPVANLESWDWRHPNLGILGLEKFVKIVLFLHVK